MQEILRRLFGHKDPDDDLEETRAARSIRRALKDDSFGKEAVEEAACTSNEEAH